MKHILNNRHIMRWKVAVAKCYFLHLVAARRQWEVFRCLLLFSQGI